MGYVRNEYDGGDEPEPEWTCLRCHEWVGEDDISDDGLCPECAEVDA